MAEPKRDFIFLLGAGASVEAGIPDVRKFVQKFREKLERDRNGSTGEKQKRIIKKLEILDFINDKLKDSPCYDQGLDVELLLEVLIRLQKREEDILLHLWREQKDGGFFKGWDEYLKELEKELKEFIIDRCSNFDSIYYLEPLIYFLKSYKNLDIFTLNYDTCIEKLCDDKKVIYTDGFTSKWDKSLFDKSEGVRLFKIHGSVTWYRLPEKGELVKIPIKPTGKRPEHITGGRTEEVIIYPTIGKNVLVKPFFDIFYKFSERLSRVGLCVVIGYSFRDEYVRGKIIEAMKENDELYLYIIDPYAIDVIKRICNNNVDFRNRAIPLEMKTGEALGKIDLKENIEKIFRAKEDERKAIESINGHYKFGNPELWRHSLTSWYELGHFDRFKSLLEEIYGKKYISEEDLQPDFVKDLKRAVYAEQLDRSIHNAVEYYSKEDLEKANVWFTLFKTYSKYLEYMVSLEMRRKSSHSHEPTIFVPVPLEEQPLSQRGEIHFDTSKLFDLRTKFEKIIEKISKDHAIYKKLIRISKSLDVLCNIEKKRNPESGKVDEEILKEAEREYKKESLEMGQIVDNIVEYIDNIIKIKNFTNKIE